MENFIRAAAILLVVSACAQTQQAAADLTAACAIAQHDTVAAAALAKGGSLATVNNIAAYVNTGCGTATAIAALATDPTSLAWVQSLSTQVKAASTS